MNFRTKKTVGMLVALCLNLCAAQNNDPPEEERTLGDAMTAYFQKGEDAKRAELNSEILTLAEGDAGKVADALGAVQVWEKPAVNPDAFVVDIGQGEQCILQAAAPLEYDPKDRWPLVLAIAPSGFVSREHIVAIVTEYRVGFNSPAKSADDVLHWLRALRKRYHLDTDRVYLVGKNNAADMAFLIAATHPDLFAGVSIENGTLDVPQGRALRPLLLANLKNTPVCLNWETIDPPPKTTLSGRVPEVAITNRAIYNEAEALELPLTVLQPAELTATRQIPIGVDHRFRYPAQGHAHFLRAGELDEPYWQGDQLDVLVTPATNKVDFTRNLLESKLPRIRGRIDGNNIDVQSEHCETVEILLGPDSVDYAQPINITYNGKRRFNDHVRPDIGLMLESAYENWEFQHPVCVRLRIGDKGSVRPF